LKNVLADKLEPEQLNRIYKTYDIVGDIVIIRVPEYLLGIGKKVISPEILRNYNPDAVIVMNTIYYDRVRQMLEDMDLTPDVN